MGSLRNKTYEWDGEPQQGPDEALIVSPTTDAIGVPKPVEALMYIMYIAVSAAAIGGNGIVCYIVVAYQRMRTVTNFFIVNLAIGDILMACLCIPFGFVSNLLLQYWPFGAVMCVLVSYAQAVSVFISAYTLIAISIDRYIAILYPLRPRMTKLQAKVIIVVVWVVALITPLPTAIMSRLEIPPEWRAMNITNRQACMEDWQTNTQRYYYSMALMILQYFFPLIVLIYTYTRIAIVVWGKRTPGEAEDARDQRLAASKRKMVKMMITCVTAFTLCWLPLNTLVVVGDQHPEVYTIEGIVYVWFACHWLAMSHACCNPFIYCWMNSKFRSGFSHVFRCLPFIRMRQTEPPSEFLPPSTLGTNTTTVNVTSKVHQHPGTTSTTTTIVRMHIPNSRPPLQMVKMMITVVTVFTFCWLPLNILIVVGDQDDSIWQYEHIVYVWFVCHWLAMSHATYNPIIYCWMNSKFRDGFLQLCRQLSCVRMRRRLMEDQTLQRCNTYSTYTSVRTMSLHGSAQASPRDQLNGKHKKGASPTVNTKLTHHHICRYDGYDDDLESDSHV